MAYFRVPPARPDPTRSAARWGFVGHVELDPGVLPSRAEGETQPATLAELDASTALCSILGKSIVFFCFLFSSPPSSRKDRHAIMRDGRLSLTFSFLFFFFWPLSLAAFGL